MHISLTIFSEFDLQVSPECKQHLDEFICLVIACRSLKKFFFFKKSEMVLLGTERQFQTSRFVEF